MGLVKWAVTHVAPVFIVTSPVTSYADQIWSISKNRSSAGFSLDIPLIMLVSSILKYGPQLPFPTLSRLSKLARTSPLRAYASTSQAVLLVRRAL